MLSGFHNSRAALCCNTNNIPINTIFTRVLDVELPLMTCQSNIKVISNVILDDIQVVTCTMLFYCGVVLLLSVQTLDQNGGKGLSHFRIFNGQCFSPFGIKTTQLFVSMCFLSSNHNSISAHRSDGLSVSVPKNAITSSKS
jgi:hypothetical protein